MKKIPRQEDMFSDFGPKRPTFVRNEYFIDWCAYSTPISKSSVLTKFLLERHPLTHIERSPITYTLITKIDLSYLHLFNIPLIYYWIIEDQPEIIVFI